MTKYLYIPCLHHHESPTTGEWNSSEVVKKIGACLKRAGGENFLYAHMTMKFSGEGTDAYTRILSRVEAIEATDLFDRLEHLKDLKHILDDYMRVSHTGKIHITLERDNPYIDKNQNIAQMFGEIRVIFNECNISGTSIAGNELNPEQRARLDQIVESMQREFEGYYNGIISILEKREIDKIKASL